MAPDRTRDRRVEHRVVQVALGQCHRGPRAVDQGLLRGDVGRLVGAGELAVVLRGDLALGGVIDRDPALGAVDPLLLGGLVSGGLGLQ